MDCNVAAQGLPGFDQELMKQGLKKLVRRAGQGSVGPFSEVCLVFGYWGKYILPGPLPPCFLYPCPLLFFPLKGQAGFMLLILHLEFGCVSTFGHWWK